MSKTTDYIGQAAADSTNALNPLLGGLNRQELLGITIWRNVATYEAHAAKLPFALQHHGETVHYRNIWLRPLS